MERKFTLRLSEEENKKLQELRVLLNEKTDTGTITKVICQFKALSDSEINTRRQLIDVTRKADILKQKVQTFLSAFSALKQ